MLKPRKRLVKAKLKEDKLLVFVARMQGLVNRYQRQVIYALVGVLAVVVIAVVYSMSKRAAENNAAFEAFLARDAYMRGDLDAAMEKADLILEDFPGTHSAAQALSLKGRIQEQVGELETAEQTYLDLIRKYSEEEYLAFGAYYSLGAIYYSRGDYEKAARYYQDAARKYPRHFNAPDALMRAGECYRKASRYDDAKRVYRRILKEYPKSKTARGIDEELAAIEFMS